MTLIEFSERMKKYFSSTLLGFFEYKNNFIELSWGITFFFLFLTQVQETDYTGRGESGGLLWEYQAPFPLPCCLTCWRTGIEGK